MIAGLIALTLAAAFAGAALYINIAEHPARMLIDDASALAQWSPSYARAFNFQGGLAMASGVAGLIAIWLTSDWKWAIGAVLMLVNWPYTLIAILPLNNRLNALAAGEAGPASRAMLARWNRLHAVRSGLSIAAVAAYLWIAASSCLVA